MAPPVAVRREASTRMHALTSLRFFAALFVVLFHVYDSPSFLTWIDRQGIVAQVIQLGHVSVGMFFLLSGYILAVVYLRGRESIATKAFYKARFARVYPLFLLTLAIDTPYFFLNLSSKFDFKDSVIATGTKFVANMLMLQAWFPRMRGIDNPNWSLSAETFFYLIFPIVGALLWKLRGKMLLLAAISIYVGGQAAVFLLTPEMNIDRAKFFPALHLSTFLIGILLARWQSTHFGQASGYCVKALRYGPWLGLGAASIGFAAAVRWSSSIPNLNLYDGLLAPVFVCLIWAFSYDTWWPARLLSARWLVVLGESSFALYLLHIPVFHIFQYYGWQNNPLLFPVYLALTTGLSVVSFYYFETPMRRPILRVWQVNHPKESMESASAAQ